MHTVCANKQVFEKEMVELGGGGGATICLSWANQLLLTCSAVSSYSHWLRVKNVGKKKKQKKWGDTSSLAEVILPFFIGKKGEN